MSELMAVPWGSLKDLFPSCAWGFRCDPTAVELASLITCHPSRDVLGVLYVDACFPRHRQVHTTDGRVVSYISWMRLGFERACVLAGLGRLFSGVLFFPSLSLVGYSSYYNVHPAYTKSP